MTTVGKDDREWTKWPGGIDLPAYTDLASYVVTMNLPGRLRVPPGVGTIRERTEAVYRCFASEPLPWRSDHWSPGPGQWIKDPQWFVDDSGTCLDFAVTFAAACLHAAVASLLVVLETGSRSHALVVVDTSRDFTDSNHRRAPMLGGSVGGEPVVALDPDATCQLLGSEHAIAVDIVRSSWPGGEALSAATDAGDERLALDHGHRAWLVDVGRLQETGAVAVRTPLVPGTERPRPAITAHFPGAYSITDYQEQPEIEAALGPDGLGSGDYAGVVLCGVQGAGKSLAALIGARRLAPDRCGWFLNATDRESLVASYALAAAAEVQVRDSLVGTGEEARWFAGIAKERLRVRSPWLVVLDNVDVRAADFGDELPRPDVAAGQRLVVTTTQVDEWKPWAEARALGAGHSDGNWLYVAVEPLQRTALDALGTPEAVRDVVRGRALFARAFGVLARKGAPMVTVEHDGVDPAAAMLWASAMATLDDELARLAVGAAAWMQPDGIDIAVVARCLDIPESQAVAAVDALADVGLVRREDARFVVHRLVAAAVRASADPLAVLDLIARDSYVEDAKRRADSHTIRLMTEILDRSRPAPDDLPAAERWAVAVWTKAAVLEQRGQASRADADCQAITELLGAFTVGELSPSGKGVLANALHGLARKVNQQPRTTHGEARRAIEHYVVPSEELRRAVSEDDVSKSRTMRGLLMQKAIPPGVATEERIRLLKEARDILTEAVKLRRRRFDALHEDTARAEFNLGGVNVQLAQADPVNVAGYLKLARDAYRVALTTRQHIYPTALHPFRAASDYGFALADFYDALIGDHNLATRVRLLRDAEESCTRSKRARQTLDGTFDGADTGKSIELSEKIDRLRNALIAYHEADLAAERQAQAAGRFVDISAPAGKGAANGRARIEVSVRAAVQELDEWSAARPDLRELTGFPGTDVRAVITTRWGGVSVPPFDTLNLGFHDLGHGRFDDAGRVATNRRLLCDYLGVRRLTVTDQRHRAKVVHITPELAGAGHASMDDAVARLGATDGMVTDLPGVALTILVADCVPVAFWDPVHSAIGVAHAGRGGTVLGIVVRVVETMAETFGTVPADLLVGFGPHVARDGYEVGPAEVAAFRDRFPSRGDLLVWTDRENGKASLDLEGALRTDLIAAGVPEGSIHSDGIDTRSSTDCYFSDREERPTGRFGLVSWIPER